MEINLTDFNPAHDQEMVINLKQNIDQLIDGYESHEPHISHWLQKDGIQNCWDARKDRTNAKGWMCEIALNSNKKFPAITITDSGTWGLTGDRFTQDELMSRDPGPDERWTRFENLNFVNSPAPKSTGDYLGSRGRGKFVLSAASENNEIYYDTVLDKPFWGINGTQVYYRIGKRKLEKTRAPNSYEDGELAKQVLRDKTKGTMKPLSHTGTRIIIPKPKKEVIDDFINRKGHTPDIAKFIAETWWEIIDSGAKIILNKDGIKQQIPRLSPHIYPDKPFSTEQKIFTQSNIQCKTGKILKFYINFDPSKEIPVRYRGIAIQRGGMNICRKSIVGILGSQYEPHITGYVKFDDSLEGELKKAEGVEHYSINWRHKSVDEIDSVLNKLVKDFAKNDLGWTEPTLPRVTPAQRRQTENTVRTANEILKSAGFGIGGKTSSTKTKKHRPPIPPKDISVTLNAEFPKPGSERINFGESFPKIGAMIENNLKSSDVKVGLRIMVLSYERDTVIYGKPIHVEEILVKRKSHTGDLYMKPLKIENRLFTPGRYKIVADIALLESYGGKLPGEKLDEASISFWVETDPPEGGLFEDFIATEFSRFPVSDPKRDLRSYVEEGKRHKDTYIMYYNTDHYDFLHMGSGKKDKSKYEYRLCLAEACLIDIDVESYNLIKKEDAKDPYQCAVKMKSVIDKMTGKEFMEKFDAN